MSSLIPDDRQNEPLSQFSAPVGGQMLLLGLG